MAFSALKPTAMLEDALLDLTQRDGFVLDPFLGPGSTLIAAAKTGRVCRAVEIDPRYVDVIVRRLEAATDVAAEIVETGDTFDQISARRAIEGPTVPVYVNRRFRRTRPSTPIPQFSDRCS